MRKAKVIALMLLLAPLVLLGAVIVATAGMVSDELL
jgi:hypothetical protein